MDVLNLMVAFDEVEKPTLVTTGTEELGRAPSRRLRAIDVERQDALAPLGAAIPDVPRCWDIGKSSPSATLFQPEGFVQASTVVVVVVPVELQSKNVE
jgi:hypothetical protein